MTASVIENEEGVLIEPRSLPNGWRLFKLGDVFDFLDSCRIPVNNSERAKRIAGKAPSELYPYYGANGQVGWIDDYLFDEKLILLAEDGGNFGSKDKPIAYAVSGRFWVNNHAHVLRPKEGFDFDYCLHSIRIRPDVGHLVSGSTRAKLNQEIAAQIPVPVPPLTEQKRIAAILNEQVVAVEHARAAAEAQLKAANALPVAYLHTVFGSLEAQQWTKGFLGDLLVLRKEIIHPRDNPKGATVFVGLEHIESGTGERIGSINLEMSELTGRKPKFYKGDVVYGYLRPYLNKVWVAEFDGLCSVDQYVYSVIPDKADVDFIAWFMRSPIYLNRAPIDLTPGQLPRIRTEEVATVELNLPPIDEQKRIAEYINKKMTSVRQMYKALQEQLKSINKMPAALLNQAFIGKL